jgi:hypothetical protein
MEDWAAAGYANPASFRYAMRERARKEDEAEMRRHQGELAARARRLNRSGAEAASTVFHLPPEMNPRD